MTQFNEAQHLADAHNALAMALHYLRQPGDANVAGATRKAVQALAGLRRLNVPTKDIRNPEISGGLETWQRLF